MNRCSFVCQLFFTLCWIQISQQLELGMTLDSADKVNKREIFREVVAPGLGGVIPEGALSAQRLQHNSHDSVGIESPEGLVFIPRDVDVRPINKDPEDVEETLKLGRESSDGSQLTLGGRSLKHILPTTYLLRRPVGYAASHSESVIGTYDSTTGAVRQENRLANSKHLPLNSFSIYSKQHQPYFFGRASELANGSKHNSKNLHNLMNDFNEQTLTPVSHKNYFGRLLWYSKPSLFNAYRNVNFQPIY